ncbi:hypothetical protein K443DRAFT_274643 [Laccaria amethystina LaAM-08-1]|uniref:Uncharacterized protein n=1 Tax=Laccaria amethystina LaAM-08-1 TaxID=1095629 RepID=A0A0C9XKG5_9AGAR|nr:hypothetical protein K443DRAFT_274643 [Laccaria amethystina LaAM-08-1]
MTDVSAPGAVSNLFPKTLWKPKSDSSQFRMPLGCQFGQAKAKLPGRTPFQSQTLSIHLKPHELLWSVIDSDGVDVGYAAST